PDRSWIVSHKVVGQAAGMGKIGIHRNLIHPKYGSFILLGTVFIAARVKEHTTPIAYNPCVECRLCVSACPVGAIKSDGYFDFSACYTHNYQQFMGGFVNWVEDIADSKSAQEYSKKVSYSETVTRWQSLSYGPNYNSAYCLAVCPAGEDVMGPFLADKKAFVANIMTPLLEKKEPVYVVKGTDAEATLIRRFPHKKLKYVRPSGRATTIKIFFMGIRLGFQPGKAKNLNATYHFTFTGEEKPTSEIKATVIIQNQTLQVLEGHQGNPDLQVKADSKSWLGFLNHEISIVRCLLLGKIKLKGSPKLLIAFGKCFPS
ncbi:MAG: SCP2 sterol-binding domain-containing protein, partial [Cyanobacteria bacterium]|nr:SCP2 sterol-binding domain-containing protein [Cyanobacteriota bacterium]